MLKSRSSGILCHVSSLPSSYGIGDLGPASYAFVDMLAAAGQKWWQVLPLNPTDRALGNSPYSSFSAFAFNTLFISPDQMLKDGHCLKGDIELLKVPPSDSVRFDVVYENKSLLIERAYECYRSSGKLPAFELFCRDQAGWLEDYALFVVLKKNFTGACWVDWPVEFRDRSTTALRDFSCRQSFDLEREKFAQFLFYDQWMKLKDYCLGKGIGIIGDIPIYVNYDSVDVWVNPRFFKLDAQRRQTFVAGVPPDYFSKDGQRWGNPVYDWESLSSTGFSWWVERMRHNLGLFDAARIDHFRAFAQCWEIPAHEPTPINGAWRDVPGKELFLALRKQLPDLPVIAEDLGIITPDVDALKDLFGFPGMRVVMFAFHNEYKKSRDLPENFTRDSIVYTGTHDNNTVRGWFREDMTAREKENFMEYFKARPSLSNIHWKMIRMAMGSAAMLCVIPIQDVLGLGSEARMNRPSTVAGNWCWRIRRGAISPKVITHLRRLTLVAGR